MLLPALWHEWDSAYAGHVSQQVMSSTLSLQPVEHELPPSDQAYRMLPLDDIEDRYPGYTEVFTSHGCNTACDFTQLPQKMLSRMDRLRSRTSCGKRLRSYETAAMLSQAAQLTSEDNSFIHFTGVPALFAGHLLGVPES